MRGSGEPVTVAQRVELRSRMPTSIDRNELQRRRGQAKHRRGRRDDALPLIGVPDQRIDRRCRSVPRTRGFPTVPTKTRLATYL